jgi:predicted ester cyclase
MDNGDVFRRYMIALAKPDSIPDIVAAAFAAHDMPPPGNRETLITFRRAVMTAFPDQAVEILDTVSEGDRLAARWRATQTHTGQFRDVPATGKRIIFDGHEFVRIRDGKIAERWVMLYPSIEQMLAQLRAA